MNKSRLRIPLDPRAVDAAQDEISLMASDGDVTGLNRTARSLIGQSERARLDHPRDASRLSELGNLATDAARDILADRGIDESARL